MLHAQESGTQFFFQLRKYLKGKEKKVEMTLNHCIGKGKIVCHKSFGKAVGGKKTHFL